MGTLATQAGTLSAAQKSTLAQMLVQNASSLVKAAGVNGAPVAAGLGLLSTGGGSVVVQALNVIDPVAPAIVKNTISSFITSASKTSSTKTATSTGTTAQAGKTTVATRLRVPVETRTTVPTKTPIPGLPGSSPDVPFLVEAPKSRLPLILAGGAAVLGIGYLALRKKR